MNEESERELVNKLAVPVYEDVLKPFGQEISKGLVSVARSVNSGVFLMEECVQATVNVLRLTGEKLALLPPKEISFSNPRVALQALDQAKFSVNEVHIQELFANLIASSLTEESKGVTHPAYIEIIKQLQGDEALILQFMERQEAHMKGHAPTIDLIIEDDRHAGLPTKSIITEFNLIAEDAGCMYPENSVRYFENLKRIGLINHVSGSTSFPQNLHQRIFESSKAREVYENGTYKGQKASWKFGNYSVTTFGRAFSNAVIRT
ncbi:TPA: DUF4393 domain-containing protein [Vibrio cholerae]|nr:MULTISPECIES: DUF4393 domain-containing protein [Vibrio]MBJ6934242.1 DUF4393 domain-containing protein [Vibrio cholerae]MBJ6954481.1 DUF4393 domain-containing protein [Vibrio cholerae]RBM85507.1 DUF4393 domain-containing protein [Vibrio paracholerae]HDV5461224.1 DUF4393 domain-containing protein [Vibrio cholerae]HDV5542345.1 DUF4393 domain-containing protein [Vibrio cholerae]